MDGQPRRYESAVEEAIRTAQERGAFDDLPGKGEPLPGLDGPDDELWWVRGYLRREGLSTEDLLPESLLLRRRRDRVHVEVAELRTEQAVREHVAELNRQIRRARVVTSGPPVILRTADPDEVVARWRSARPAPPVPGVAAGTGREDGSARSRWWRPRRRRG